MLITPMPTRKETRLSCFQNDGENKTWGSGAQYLQLTNKGCNCRCENRTTLDNEGHTSPCKHSQVSSKPSKRKWEIYKNRGRTLLLAHQSDLWNSNTGVKTVKHFKMCLMLKCVIYCSHIGSQMAI